MVSGAPVLNTLANGLRALEVLADGPKTLREIAEGLELPRQTAYRIVHTLCVTGWAARNEADDTYRLLTTVWSIGARAREAFDPREQWSHAVTQLAADTGETALVAVYEKGAAIYVARCEGWQPVRTYTKLGARSPAYCVATGKVLLSYQPPAELDRVAAEGFKPFTPHTITSSAALAAQLAVVRDQGYATNFGEYQEEVGGVALPIRSVDGEVIAAMGVSGPVSRIEDRVEDLRARIRLCIQHNS